MTPATNFRPPASRGVCASPVARRSPVRSLVIHYMTKGLEGAARGPGKFVI